MCKILGAVSVSDAEGADRTWSYGYTNPNLHDFCNIWKGESPRWGPGRLDVGTQVGLVYFSETTNGRLNFDEVLSRHG
jgi:hypothetical protein